MINSLWLASLTKSKKTQSLSKCFWEEKKEEQIDFGTCCLTLFVSWRGGKFASSLGYFNIAPKLTQSFALMHPDFKSNLITNIFRQFGVSRTTESDIIFAFVKGTQGVLCYLSTMHAYQTWYYIYCTAYSLSMLIFSWIKMFYFLINALHHHYVIDDVIIQKYCFFCCFSK